MVRAKFKCVDKEEVTQGDQPSTFNLKFEVVTSGSEENDSFFRWTPSGSIVMSTVNQGAADDFEKGSSYYVDFTPVTD